jgi:predicted SAM-dependent methyltransferase
VTFQNYSARLVKSGWTPGGDLDGAPSRPQLSTRAARWLVPKPLRATIKTTLTRAKAPWERRKAATLVAAGAPLRLHLGCGPTHLEGWVNVDLVSTRPDLAWDLSRPAPFPDESVAAIFHEHLLEHLPLPAAIGFLHECHRLLRPGGVLRLGVPDFGRYARDYSGSRTLIGRARPGRPSALMALSEMVFCYEHASMWDEETTVSLLREVGFSTAQARGFGDSAIQPAPDRPWRELETLYVEAVKV